MEGREKFQSIFKQPNLSCDQLIVYYNYKTLCISAMVTTKKEITTDAQIRKRMEIKLSTIENQNTRCKQQQRKKGRKNFKNNQKTIKNSRSNSLSIINNLEYN